MNNFQVGFGKENVKIREIDLPIRDFEVLLTDLTTRVVLFGNDRKVKFAIVSISLTSITTRDCNLFKKKIADETNLSFEHIWICATHTFSAPHLKQSLKTKQDQKEYQRFLSLIYASIEVATKKAKSDFQTVKVSYQTSNCFLNVNRNVKTQNGYWLGRNFNGYSDHQIRIVGFEKSDGTSNLIFNYDIQPSVMDHIVNNENKKIITGDIFGIAAANIEQKSSIVVVPLIGCAGDQSPIFKGQSDYTYEQNITLLFAEAKVLSEAIDQAIVQFVDEKPKISDFVISVDLPAQIRQKDTFSIKPTLHYDFKKSNDLIHSHIYGLNIGKITLLGTEAELNSKYADKCRNQVTSEALLISTMVNGGLKYLPEEDDFMHISYQAMNSSIGQGADKKMLSAFKKVNDYVRRG